MGREPLTAIWGIGPRIAARLGALGLRKLAQAQRLSDLQVRRVGDDLHVCGSPAAARALAETAR